MAEDFSRLNDLLVLILNLRPVLVMGYPYGSLGYAAE